MAEKSYKYRGIRSRPGGYWRGGASKSTWRRNAFTVQPDVSPLQVVAARAHDMLAGREDNLTDALWNEVSICRDTVSRCGPTLTR